MKLDYQSVFNEVMRHVPELGVEKNIADLGQAVGPPNPLWMQGAILYEIYVRAFSEQGTFEAVRERLPRLKEFGIDVVWFMPIYPIGRKNRKGSLGSPYAIRDYFTVNPEYGTEADFKRLIEQAHYLGMRVILDMVPNHVAPDFVSLEQMPHLIVLDENGVPRRKVADWTDIVDLNYAKRTTWDFMARVMTYWIREFDVDGYRCDVAGLVPNAFWQWIIPQLRAVKSDFYLLAEWESPLLHQIGFNSTYDWSTLRLLRLAFQGKIAPRLLAEWVLVKTALYPQNSLPLRFAENHDVPRAALTFPAEQLLAAITFLFALHGIPLLYNGQEVGATNQPSLFEKENIPWDKKNKRVYAALKRLIQLRKSEKGLRSNSYFFDQEALNRGFLVFDKDESLRIIINLTNREQNLEQNLISNVKAVLFDSQEPDGSSDGILPRLKPFQALITKI